MMTRIKLFAILFISIGLLSSCSTSLYIHKQGTVNITKHNTYEVSYVANLGESVTAKISFTDQDTKITKLKAIVGNWSKTVKLNAGQRVKFKVVTKSEAKQLSSFKVLVNGESLSGKEINHKKTKYSYSFILP